MAVGMLAAGTIVKAVDHWNPLATLANTVEANLATEVTNRSTAVAAINTRLGNNIAGAGISDLPAWKVTIDNRTTDASTGNVALGGRVTTLETRTTDGTTGNAALGTRVSSLEAAGAAVGAWVAVTSFQNSWANRTPSGTQYYALKVRTEPGGVIRIVGNITAASGAANGLQLFTLPTLGTYAPSLESFVTIMDSAANARCLRIQANGQVFMYSSATSAAALNINGTYPGPSSGA